MLPCCSPPSLDSLPLWSDAVLRTVPLKAALAAEAKQPEATWAEVFSPEMRRRLLIGWGTQFNQQLTGINVIMIYSVVILSSTGKPRCSPK